MALTASCAVQPPAEPDASAGNPAEVPTWNHGIAALVGEHCGGCHAPGGAGPFPLQRYEDVAALAPLVAHVTAARRMPPWPADTSGSCESLAGSRWLTTEAIEALGAWADHGAPLGDAPAAPVAIVRPSTGPAIAASATLRAPRPQTIAPGPDHYRCFVADLPAGGADQYLTGFQVRLDAAEVVHHIQLYVLEDDAARGWAANADAADAGDGFECTSVPYGRYLEVWSPGDTVRRYPSGIGQHVPRGAQVLYQLHYHPGDSPRLDHTAVDLELTAEVERPARIRSVTNYPLELPPGLAELEVSREHELAGGLQQLVGVRVHMHTAGTSARLELLRDGDTHCLLDIPRWDFEWQLFYFLQHPLATQPGDRLRLTCRYDTRGRTEVTRWGASTDAEMCIGYVLMSAR